MSLIVFLVFILTTLLYRLFMPNKVDPYDGFFARIIAHSKGYDPNHNDLITFHLMYPRFIHSEMMTHKDFSRSAASSRAIPVRKMLSQVWNKPAMPIHWGKNQPGMQAAHAIQGWKKTVLRNLWMMCGRAVCVFVWVAMKMGLHKQVANRMLEPWQLMQVTLTTCKLANFYNLRIHADAQPEIRQLATLMRLAHHGSEPKILHAGEWHLPWITEGDIADVRGMVGTDEEQTKLLKKMSAARCARSSYANFDGKRSIDGDLATYSKLVDSEPVHASPCEHQATPDQQITAVVSSGNTTTMERQWKNPPLHGNLTGYIQYRNTIVGHYFPDPTKT